jgi:predicted TIM-barrel fold metal-dependent hydrolase
LAQADLVMDSATPDIDLLQGLLRINDAIPDLRIVIDHLPAFEPTAEASAPYDALLRELHLRPAVFMKLSQIIHRVNGKVSTQLADYRARLDRLFEIFGEDRITFGSDYPNSDMTTPVENVFAIARAYCATRSKTVAEKLLWRNSRRIYKWTPRTAAQAGLI